mmetsp:Transcript_6315/g.9624  ORF Transcript_6315/g.9624 Transcript_6315/m.9624 type:complete len:85 (-) Transcript_6315:22-276(-)
MKMMSPQFMSKMFGRWIVRKDETMILMQAPSDSKKDIKNSEGTTMQAMSNINMDTEIIIAINNDITVNNIWNKVKTEFKKPSCT